MLVELTHDSLPNVVSSNDQVTTTCLVRIIALLSDFPGFSIDIQTPPPSFSSVVERSER